MAIPTSGALSMSQIASELGVGASGLNLGRSSVRSLAGNGGGAISFSSLYGKSNSYIRAAVGNDNGYSIGFSIFYTPYGSTNVSNVNGMRLGSLYFNPANGPDGPKVVIQILSSYALPKNFFNSVTVNGNTYYTANAIYPIYYNAVSSTWALDCIDNLMVAGNQYPLSFA
jgi:hypothetical protein